MSVQTVYQYQLYCNTEATYVTTYQTSTPTVCPNNIAHSINTDSITILDTISNDIVKVQQETTTTGGHFKCHTRVINITTTGTVTSDLTWPFVVTPLSVYFITTSDHVGDNFEINIAPDTTVGNITANVASSATTVTVSAGAITAFKVGYYLTLADGTNTDDMGRVTVVNTATNQLTAETPTTHSFLAITPTLVKLTIKPVVDYEIGPAGAYTIGVSNLQGNSVPANTTIRWKYTSNSGTTKKFVGKVELLY